MISKQLPDLIVLLIILKLKRALGEGGCDALIQASYSALNYWNDDSLASIRDKCCCTTFILAGGKPYHVILGVVWTDKFIVQRHTDLILYKLARVFTTLGECHKILDHYYEDIYDRRDSIKSLVSASNGTTKFEYGDALENDPATVTFLAKTTTGKPCPLVIKFVDRSGVETLSPPCGVSRCADLYIGPWRMVVMEYIDGRTAQQVPRDQWPTSAYNDVKAALNELHKANHVFGDLCLPNVMFNAGEVCYPKGLSSAVSWPKGVTDFAPIEKEHDEAMLEAYFSVKSID
ncbi:hypothetical protein IW261DRAFT_1552331 [Armillaria novae-zelandiae]|uniref:Aminoglycoside phosphotransferase domain-containing protein n=1 Tax=Armillaria novae-zelandiae TaxID=153914 RepID=A0AA39P2G9_9AGAR|nr:hypothetical protein IW261DRAFT_1552331 [Armillaria novae-zelandiae]